MVWITAAVVSSFALVTADQVESGKRKELVKVSLVAHDSAVKPGDTLQLGIVLDVAKDWHVYWPGQNDTGMPTSVELSFPPGSGFTAGAVSFPLPTRHVENGDISLDYILERKVVLTVPVKVAEKAAVGSNVTVAAKVGYLVCNEACQPGEADVSITIAIADKTQPGPAAKLIDDARAAQPKPQSDGFDAAATAKWEALPAAGTQNAAAPRTLTIQAKDAAATEVTFYPLDGAAKLRDPIKTGTVKGNTLRLTFEPGAKPVAGVLAVKAGNAVRAWSFSVPAPSTTGAGGASGGSPSPAR